MMSFFMKSHFAMKDVQAGRVRGITREGHEGRAHPPKNFDFGF